MKISKKTQELTSGQNPQEPLESRASRGRARQGKLNPAGDVLSHGKLQLQSCRSPSCPLQLPTTMGRQEGGKKTLQGFSPCLLSALLDTILGPWASARAGCNPAAPSDYYRAPGSRSYLISHFRHFIVGRVTEILILNC